MASTTFSNPGIGNFFSGLAGILGGPDASTLIEADYKKTLRGKALADTAYTNQQTTDLQTRAGALDTLSGYLTDPANYNTPEGRALITSMLPYLENGLQYGPQFAMGAGSFTNPNFLPTEADFSRALVGTGTVSDFGNTPEGQGRALTNELAKNRQLMENNLAVQALVNQGNLAKQGVENAGSLAEALLTPTTTSGRGALALVTPKVAGDLTEMVDNQIASTMGEHDWQDPQLRYKILDRAGQLYQTYRDMNRAVSQAIEEAALTKTGGWFGTPLGVQYVGDGAGLDTLLSQGTPGGAGAGVAPNMSAIPADLLAAAGITGANPNLPQTTPDNPTPPPPGAPQAATPAKAAAPSGPQVHFNNDGSGFYVGPDNKPVPVQDGLVLRDKASGQLIVWTGGKWQPYSQRGK